MFSTNDDEARHIEVWVIDGQGERRLEITNDHKASGLATFPSEKRLSALGTRMAEAERSRGAELHRVRVAAWRRDFIAPAMEPRHVLIREVVIDLGESSFPR